MEIRLCDECGVPEPFYKGQEWLNNGDIVQKANHRARMGFVECENLDPLFANMEQLLQAPVDRLVTEIVTRGTAIYLDRVIPERAKQMARNREIPLGMFIDSITTLCHVMGYGQYEFKDYVIDGNREDFARMVVVHPFSVPEAAGAFAGAITAVIGGAHHVTRRETAPGRWEFSSRWSESPEPVTVKPEPYRHVDGDFELEKCPTCGSPKAFSGYHWYLKKGVIVDEKTSRRMALLGHELLGSVFAALERELGEAVPRVVVEAQRRFVKTGFFSVDRVGNEDELRTYLALRGLGNLRHVRIGMGGLDLRVANASCHLMTVGMAQGLFEIALDTGSNVEWELSEGNDLTVEVTPASGRTPVLA